MNRVHNIYCRSDHWRRRLYEVLPWCLDGVPLTGARVLEIGSGPGLATDWLRPRVGALATIDTDSDAVDRLRRRRPDVDVHLGDGASLPFDDEAFDVVVCFTMLHHVPTTAQQDSLLGEAARVLRPGGIFAGSDSRTGALFALIHLRDTMNIVPPDQMGPRLAAAGLVRPQAEVRPGVFRFRASKPLGQEPPETDQM